MDEAAIKKKLRELGEVMSALPSQGPDKDAVEGVYIPMDAQSTEDSLDQLRLQVKYLVFDLEATRRENKYLRQMIENRRRRRADGSDEGSSEF
jgi:hypothetical protein